ncbi:hypothetical protein Tco_0459453, partial [Tanacetum coccineum]
FFPFSIQDLRHCAALPPPSTTFLPPSPPPIPTLHDVVLQNGLVKRNFNTYGSAAYNFVLMSAYRGGPNTFAVIGLSSKPLHVFAKPSYVCEWVPLNGTHNVTVQVQGVKILPDWGYGRVYTVVVVNCTFPRSVVTGQDRAGGNLLVHASIGGGGDTDFNLTDTIEALHESPGSLTVLRYTEEPNRIL